MTDSDRTIASLHDLDGHAGTQLDTGDSAGSLWVARRALPPELAVDYEIVGIVGHGSQAEVYQCRPKAGGIDVAIKLYTSPNHRLNSDVTRLIESADPAHILPTQFGASASEQWEVQELITAGTLADLRINGTQLDYELVRRIVAESAAALAFAHGIGLLHRDLKPSNILVRSREPLDLVLADFGLARELIAGTEVGSTSHTPGYASPEALRDEIHGFPGDWWSLGITLFEVSAGRHPFADAEGRRWSDYRIGAFLERQDVDVSVIQDQRIRLLLSGLLTRDYRQRWTFEQVQDWLNGGEPTVVVSLKSQEAPWNWTFAGFLGQAFDTPEALGDALLDNWSAAAKFLGDRRSAGALHDALAQTSHADRVHTAFERYARNTIGLDGLVFELGRILSPNRPLMFRGIELNNEGLEGVGRRAVEGDLETANWITRLIKEEILQKTIGHPDYVLYVEIDRQLASLLAEIPQLVERAKQVQATWFAQRGDDSHQASRVDLDAIGSAQPVALQGQVFRSVLAQGVDAAFAQSAVEAARGPGWIGDFAEMSVAPQQVVLRDMLVPMLARASSADFNTVEAALKAREAAEERARIAREQQAERERIARRQAEERAQRARKAAAAAAAQAERDRNAANRRSDDWQVLGVAVVASVTVLAPWLLGRYVLRAFWGASQGVFDTAARDTGEYFLSDWFAGSAVLLLAACAFVVFRPWYRRVASLVVSAIVIGLVSIFLVPAAADRWEQAEAATVERLNAGVFPFSDHYYHCGQKSSTFRYSDGSRVTWSIFFGRYVNDPKDVGCTHAVLYKGWKKIANIDFPSGTYIQKNWFSGGNASVETYGSNLEDWRFVVTFANGATMTVHLNEYTDLALMGPDQKVSGNAGSDVAYWTLPTIEKMTTLSGTNGSANTSFAKLDDHSSGPLVGFSSLYPTVPRDG